MRALLLLVLPLLIAWENPLEGTVYDRDMEGIPRAAWIDIGRIMNCVRKNEAHLYPAKDIPVTTHDLYGIRVTKYMTVRLLRQGRIKDGTDWIEAAMTEMRRISKVDCPNVVTLR